MRPFCNCGDQMKVEKNGVVLRLETPDGRYYGHVHTDSYRCPNCRNLIYSGFGKMYHAENDKFDRVMTVT